LEKPDSELLNDNAIVSNIVKTTCMSIAANSHLIIVFDERL